MSRIGKMPVVILKGVTVSLEDSHVKVKGHLGELDYTFTKFVTIKRENDQIKVSAIDDTKRSLSLWGTTRTLINNMIVGVHSGFTKSLEYTGVGYKASVKGSILYLNLGHSHPIPYQLPEGVTVKVTGNNIHIHGCSKELVGFVAAKVRSFRPPEPYKGKGIKYKGEIILRKSGKTSGK